MATVSTGVVADPSVGIDMGDVDADAISTNGEGLIVEPGAEDEEDHGSQGDEGTGIDAGTTDGDATDADDDGEDLGEFSDDTLDAYDTRYRGDNGELRLDRLTQEWDKNAAGAEGGLGHLNEGTYQYLEATYGLSKSQVQDIEAGQAALRVQYFSKIAEVAGGNDNLAAAVEWGKKAYSPEARKRFNEAYRSGDVDRATEAVEALMSRFNKANGKTARRPVRPLRSATSNAGGGAGTANQGYATREEWQTARKEARGDRKKEAEVARKFRASNPRKWNS